MNKLTRRQLMQSALFGASYVGLQSMVSGIPISALRDGILPSAYGSEEDGKPQFLVLSTSGDGDPFNAIVPGCYGVPGVHTNPNPEMSPVSLSLGGSQHQAAKPFETLPQWALDRSTFIHHRTYQNAHPQYGKVMTLLGKVKSVSGNGTDQLSALISAENAMGLQTIQQEQVSLGGGRVSFQGRSVQSLKPTLLRDMLAPLQGQEAQLQKLRDKTLDRMHSILGAGATPSQKQWLERHALSRNQSRSINEALLEGLGGIRSDRADDQVRAAVILILMKVAPVITLHIHFGRDNHTDRGLVRERDETVAGMASMKLFFEKIKQAGVEDQVTLANFGVFGRTLRFQEGKGRDHNLNHHVMMITGAKINPGVIGGIEPVGKDYGCMAIDSKTGEGIPKERASTADIQADESLESTAKTLALALGVKGGHVDARIERGRPILAALNM